MNRQERLVPFNFLSEIGGVLPNLIERVRRTGSLRVAIAHQIEEEGLFLRDIVEELLPQAQVAVYEYTFVGTLILEAESARQSGYFSKEVALLEEDPRGFSLLVWWVNRGLEEFKTSSAPKGEKQAVLIGRAAGIGRYRQLYQALIFR